MDEISRIAPRLHLRPHRPPPTKDRILVAAATLFGQRGFDGTTIRRIAELADVNLAAINYHFRSKEELHAAAVTRALDLLMLGDDGTDETQGGDLPAVIRRLVLRLASPAMGDSDGRLIMRLIAWAILRTETRPETTSPADLVADWIGSRLPGRLALEDRRAVASLVIGPCLLVAMSTDDQASGRLARVLSVLEQGLSALPSLAPSPSAR